MLKLKLLPVGKFPENGDLYLSKDGKYHLFQDDSIDDSWEENLVYFVDPYIVSNEVDFQESCSLIIDREIFTGKITSTEPWRIENNGKIRWVEKIQKIVHSPEEIKDTLPIQDILDGILKNDDEIEIEIIVDEYQYDNFWLKSPKTLFKITRIPSKEKMFSESDVIEHAILFGKQIEEILHNRFLYIDYEEEWNKYWKNKK